MLTLDPEQELYQTLPGQGWRALIVDGDIEVNLTSVQIRELPLREEPVIAWVAFRDDYTSGEAATHIAAMVRCDSNYGGCDLLTTYLQAVVFLAPGEARSAEHEAAAHRTFENLSERYKKLNKRGTK